jgi:ketosteroid isomerase-like protein
MSQENAEIVRKAVEAYARGDLDTALTNADPDIVWNPVEEAATQGRDAIRANIERWEIDFDDFEATPEHYIDAGDQVLVTIHWSGRGRGSGLRVDIRTYMVFTARDGALIRMDEFTERSDALEAAGLSE